MSSVLHLRIRQLGVLWDKQAISAAEITRKQYIFCGPSPGMFLLILCSCLMTSVMVLCSLRDSKLTYTKNHPLVDLIIFHSKCNAMVKEEKKLTYQSPGRIWSGGWVFSSCPPRRTTRTGWCASDPEARWRGCEQTDCWCDPTAPPAGTCRTTGWQMAAKDCGKESR